MTGPVVVLLSTMDHPVNGRRALARGVQAACELALRSGLDVVGLHAGDPGDAGLREALHMGVPRIGVLAMPQAADPLELLAAQLRSLRPALVIAGPRIEGGEGAGMLPYRLGVALDAPVLAASRAVTLQPDGWLVECRLGQGRVRRFSCPRGSILLADAALRPRYGSFDAMRRGRIETMWVPAQPARHFAQPDLVSARRRPRPIQPVAGRTVAERLQKISDGLAGTSRGAVVLSPDAAAARIIEEAARLGLLPPAVCKPEKP